MSTTTLHISQRQARLQGLYVGQSPIQSPGSTGGFEPADACHQRSNAARHALAQQGAARPEVGPFPFRAMIVVSVVVLALVALGYGVADATSGRPVATSPGDDHAQYIAQPGDNLWSIARRARPRGDPRPLVETLRRQLDHRVLQPGDRLLVPRPR